MEDFFDNHKDFKTILLCTLTLYWMFSIESCYNDMYCIPLEEISDTIKRERLAELLSKKHLAIEGFIFYGWHMYCIPLEEIPDTTKRERLEKLLSKISQARKDITSRGRIRGHSCCCWDPMECLLNDWTRRVQEIFNDDYSFHWNKNSTTNERFKKFISKELRPLPRKELLKQLESLTLYYLQFLRLKNNFPTRNDQLKKFIFEEVWPLPNIRLLEQMESLTWDYIKHFIQKKGDRTRDDSFIIILFEELRSLASIELPAQLEPLKLAYIKHFIQKKGYRTRDDRFINIFFEELRSLASNEPSAQLEPLKLTFIKYFILRKWNPDRNDGFNEIIFDETWPLSNMELLQQLKSLTLDYNEESFHLKGEDAAPTWSDSRTNLRLQYLSVIEVLKCPASLILNHYDEYFHLKREKATPTLCDRFTKFDSEELRFLPDIKEPKSPQSFYVESSPITSEDAAPTWNDRSTKLESLRLFNDEESFHLKREEATLTLCDRFTKFDSEALRFLPDIKEPKSPQSLYDEESFHPKREEATPTWCDRFTRFLELRFLPDIKEMKSKLLFPGAHMAGYRHSSALCRTSQSQKSGLMLMPTTIITEPLTEKTKEVNTFELLIQKVAFWSKVIIKLLLLSHFLLVDLCEPLTEKTTEVNKFELLTQKVAFWREVIIIKLLIPSLFLLVDLCEANKFELLTQKVAFWREVIIIKLLILSLFRLVDLCEPLTEKKKEVNKFELLTQKVAFWREVIIIQLLNLSLFLLVSLCEPLTEKTEVNKFELLTQMVAFWREVIIIQLRILSLFLLVDLCERLTEKTKVNTFELLIQKVAFWSEAIIKLLLLSLFLLVDLCGFFTEKTKRGFWSKMSIAFLCLPVILCDDHMLSYHHTGLYYPEEGLYLFETVGYVDDQEIDMYSSESRMNIPKSVWMEKHEDNDYWEKQTSMRRGWEKVFRDNLMILASRFNYTRSSHTLQLSYGCALHDNNFTGYYRYGFDGKDFLIFNQDTLLWTPGMQKAEISAQRWNSDSDIGKGVKSYLTEHCKSALKKYIGYGREELEKRVVPEVIVKGQRINGNLRLQCLVYGFYPRPVDVKWVRNGEDDVPSDEMSPILPHPDGTYQIRVSVEVPTKEGDTYSCHVDHSSLENVLTKKWEPDHAKILHIKIILCALALLLPVSVLAFVLKHLGKGKKEPETAGCLLRRRKRHRLDNLKSGRNLSKPESYDVHPVA